MSHLYAGCQLEPPCHMPLIGLLTTCQQESLCPDRRDGVLDTVTSSWEWQPIIFVRFWFWKQVIGSTHSRGDYIRVWLVGVILEHCLPRMINCFCPNQLLRSEKGKEQGLCTGLQVKITFLPSKAKDIWGRGDRLPIQQGCRLECSRRNLCHCICKCWVHIFQIGSYSRSLAESSLKENLWPWGVMDGIIRRCTMCFSTTIARPFSFLIRILKSPFRKPTWVTMASITARETSTSHQQEYLSLWKVWYLNNHRSIVLRTSETIINHPCNLQVKKPSSREVNCFT